MRSAELGGIIASSTALLERAHQIEENPQFSTELQLRGSVCGIATGALQTFLRVRHGVNLDRRLAVPEKAPRGVNFRLLRHVGLFTEDGKEMVDPSYSQFFEYIGLSRSIVQNNQQLVQYYPVTKVAIIETERFSAFADLIAEHAHTIEPKVAQLRSAERRPLPPIDSLVGTSLARKEEVFRDIWSPGNYDMPFPLGEQSESFQRRVARVANRMMELERQR